MEKNCLEQIVNMIEKAIQKELRYQTDSITAEAWHFLDNEAEDKVLDKLKNDIGEDEEFLKELSAEDVNAYLQDTIADWEEYHGRIRA